jgi:hypothetical protein
MLSFIKVTLIVAVWFLSAPAEAVGESDGLGEVTVAELVGVLLAELVVLLLPLLQPASANAAATATTLTCRVFTPSSC